MDETVDGVVTVTGTRNPDSGSVPVPVGSGRVAVPVTVTVAPYQTRLAEAVAPIVGEQVSVVTVIEAGTGALKTPLAIAATR